MTGSLANALLLATYPYLILGAVFAAYSYGWMAWTTRDSKLQLWWLAVGISLTMVAIALENSYWFAGRVLYAMEGVAWDDRVKQVNPMIVTFKLMTTFGCWIHFYAAVAASRGKHGRCWTLRALVIGSVVTLVSFPVAMAIA